MDFGNKTIKLNYFNKKTLNLIEGFFYIRYFSYFRFQNKGRIKTSLYFNQCPVSFKSGTKTTNPNFIIWSFVFNGGRPGSVTISVFFNHRIRLI